MRIPYSLPLNTHIITDDYQTQLKLVKDLLSRKLDMLQKLESVDFMVDESAFRKYKAIKDELDVFIPFIKTTELTLESLCEDAASCPVRLPHYEKLWVENHRLKEQNQQLERQNDLLTEILLSNGKG